MIWCTLVQNIVQEGDITDDMVYTCTEYCQEGDITDDMVYTYIEYCLGGRYNR